MTTAEQARNMQIDAAEQVLNAGWPASRVIGPRGRRLAKANQAFWSGADEQTAARLAACIDMQPLESADTPGPGITLGSKWRRTETGAIMVVGMLLPLLPTQEPLVLLCDYSSGKQEAWLEEAFLTAYEPYKKSGTEEGAK